METLTNVLMVTIATDFKMATMEVISNHYLKVSTSNEDLSRTQYSIFAFTHELLFFEYVTAQKFLPNS